MKTRLFLTIAAFIALTVIASAQTTDKKNATAVQGKSQGAAWVDANNNGICDNFENGTRLGRGQGTARGQAMHNGRGKGAGRGQGMAHGRGTGRGQGSNFIDENKNGVCDYRETPAKK
jgi:hypothetical protein